jgi:hypothetical protein
MTETNEEKQGTPENSGEGIQPKTNTLVEDTNLAAKRLEEANKEARKIMQEQEENYAKMKLGGKAEAGETVVKQETSQEYANRVMKNQK